MLRVSFVTKDVQGLFLSCKESTSRQALVVLRGEVSIC